MAFVLEQTWREEAGGRASAAPPLFPALSANGRDPYLAKTGGTLLTIGVHMLLLWLLATRLSGTAGPAPDTRTGRGPITFTLGEAGAAAPQAPAPSLPPSPARQTSELDLTVPDALPPPEWTLARIAVSEPTPPSASAAAPAAAQAGVGGAEGGTGAGGGGVYDPFAGAAPLRRDSAASPPATGSTASPILNRQLLASAARAVRRSHPKAGGTVVIAVRVSSDGVVVDAILKGGSAAAEAKEALRRALVGLQLFLPGGAGPREFDLPAVVLG